MGEITPHVAHVVLWHYGCADPEISAGYKPSGFTATLLQAISRADAGNRTRLAAGFPEHVAACQLIETDPDGAAQLRKIAATCQLGRVT